MFQMEAGVSISVAGGCWCFSWRKTLVFQLEADVSMTVGGSSNARYGDSYPIYTKKAGVVTPYTQRRRG